MERLAIIVYSPGSRDGDTVRDAAALFAAAHAPCFVDVIVWIGMSQHEAQCAVEHDIDRRGAQGSLCRLRVAGGEATLRALERRVATSASEAEVVCVAAGGARLARNWDVALRHAVRGSPPNALLTYAGAGRSRAPHFVRLASGTAADGAVLTETVPFVRSDVASFVPAMLPGTALLAARPCTVARFAKQLRLQVRGDKSASLPQLSLAAAAAARAARLVMFCDTTAPALLRAHRDTRPVAQCMPSCVRTRAWLRAPDVVAHLCRGTTPRATVREQLAKLGVITGAATAARTC